MKHSKSYKEKKSHPLGSSENPLPSKMSKKEKKGIRKMDVRMSMKHSKEELKEAHAHMDKHKR
jgi:hypothetical protein